MISQDRARPRVLRLIARLNIGGPARHTVLLDAGLRSRGYDTLLVHGNVGAGEASFEQLAAARAIPTERVPALGRRVHLWGDARACLGVWRALRRFRPDIVHTHTAKAGAIGRVVATVHNLTLPRRRRCAIVHTFHGHVLDGYFGRVGNAVARTTERALAPLTDCTIAISESQRADLVDRFRVAHPDRTVVVPLGLDLDALLRVPLRQPRAVGSPCTIGFVGRLVRIKNVETLLHAVAMVRGELPQVRVLITGDGPERPRLEALARTLGLEEAVQFVGWNEDIVATYSSLDVLAITSRNEGTPVAIIEAMAAGVPVVGTRVGGVPDVIEHGVTGLLTDVDANAIAAALLSIARDPTSAFARARQAREVVRDRNSDAALVERIASLYVEVLQRKRGIERSDQE